MQAKTTTIGSVSFCPHVAVVSLILSATLLISETTISTGNNFFALNINSVSPSRLTKSCTRIDPSPATSSSYQQKRLIVLEKVSKTGTTSIRDFLLQQAGEETCFRSSNGFSGRNKIHTLGRCSCDTTKVIISHLSRFPKFMEHVIGHCDLSKFEIVSVIPVRQDRIDSELNYGQTFLSLDPHKSIFDNPLNYGFNPYRDYSSNPFANRTCLFDFIKGWPWLPKKNPTKKKTFKCKSEVCERSVLYAKSKEREELERLHQTYPCCTQRELALLSF